MIEHQSEQNRITEAAFRNIMVDDVRQCVEAEIKEMEKYKWLLGEQLHHDPLQDRTLNDIYCEWIEKYAAEFRTNWENQKKNAGNRP